MQEMVIRYVAWWECVIKCSQDLSFPPLHNDKNNFPEKKKVFSHVVLVCLALYHFLDSGFGFSDYH